MAAIPRIFLMGTSAGAVHAASYIAHPQFHGRDGIGLAGAILLSGLYNLENPAPAPLHEVYFGKDRSLYRARSSIHGLVETILPLMLIMAELDPPDFERETMELALRLFEKYGRLPAFLRLAGHNHFTTTLHLNGKDDYLGRWIRDFCGVRASA